MNSRIWQERMPDVAAAWRSGLTLEQLGIRYGVTRERIRQVLRKFGLSPSEGGSHVRAKERRGLLRAADARRQMARYGMPRQERLALSPSVRIGYYSQQRNAKRRGIKFDLLMADWLAVWIASGKLGERGLGSNKYCMARRDDSGGYTAGNVYITTNAANGREYAIAKARGRRQRQSNHGTGIYLMYPGTKRPWVARHGKHCLGHFPTKKGAVGARNRFVLALEAKRNNASKAQSTPARLSAETSNSLNPT